MYESYLAMIRSVFLSNLTANFRWKKWSTVDAAIKTLQYSFDSVAPELKVFVLFRSCHPLNLYIDYCDITFHLLFPFWSATLIFCKFEENEWFIIDSWRGEVFHANLLLLCHLPTFCNDSYCGFSYTCLLAANVFKAWLQKMALLLREHLFYFSKAIYSLYIPVSVWRSSLGCRQMLFN